MTAEKETAKIRVIKRPEGEAPDWVRDAWIGLIIPLAEDGGVGEGKTFGTLTGESQGYSLGFRITPKTAVGVLEEHHPDAASWWKERCPTIWKEGATFRFQLDECEVVEEHGKPIEPPQRL